MHLNQSLHNTKKLQMNNKYHCGLGSELKSMLIEMAVGVAKSESLNPNYINGIKDIETLYIRCNQLLSLLHIAHSENEINISTFLSFEIQVQSLLHRLLCVSQKISSQNR